MRQIPITLWLPDRYAGRKAVTLARTASCSSSYVTDGGMDRGATTGVSDHDRLRKSVAPAVFAVDSENHLVSVAEPLSAMGADTQAPLAGQHLSSLLAVPTTDIGVHLSTVRQRLQESSASTVRSTACHLRTPEGRRSVTVEFSLHPNTDRQSAAAQAAWLVGTVREDVVELGANQHQPTAGPDRFRELFEQLPDPVTEVRFEDGEPVVMSVNPAFEETFGHEEAVLVDEPLNEYIVPESADSDATSLDREAANGEWTSAEVIREAADGPRVFLFRGIPFSHNGKQCGFGVYTDVTDRESQKRYHEVLNRLLRHNLRNDLNVILGLADQLTTSLETGETEMTAVGERLKQRALDLVETTRRARELESVIDRSDTNTTPISVDDLVFDACEMLREEHPTVTITSTIDGPAVGIGGPALREAVVELAENAVEHTTTDPTLQIRVESHPESESVVITVADDGPGIPPDERAVIDGSQSITPLDHGSGLGLWLAKWIAEAYGGEIAFVGPDPELGGAAVELRLRSPASVATDRNGSAD